MSYITRCCENKKKISDLDISDKDLIMSANIDNQQDCEQHSNDNNTIKTSPVTKSIEDQHRGNWSRKLEFLMSCLSYAVGLGSVWRFPYICYRNGGGAFLLPFIIMVTVIGIPLVFLEISFGQYGRSGVVTIWKASPIFEGIGWAMFLTSFFVSIYYNMIIAYSFYYLFASFRAILPWQECGGWSSEACSNSKIDIVKNCTDNGGVFCYDKCFYQDKVSSNTLNNVSQCPIDNLILPSDSYFHKSILNITDGIHKMGSINWELASCLLLAWAVVCLCLAKGIKSSGKTAYFTSTFPYLVLSILAVRGFTLEGSVDGIVYLFKPQWYKLQEARVWSDASVQVIYSLSPCFGGIITLSSYNKFNNNCLKDAVVISIMVCLTSVFSGIVIFSIMGYMATELNQPISEVVQPGVGLAFIVYPDVVTKLPISQLWSVLFFTMLVTLGLGSLTSIVNTVHTTLLDKFPKLFRKNQKRRILLLIGISCLCYIIGLPFTFQGGIYVFQLFDNYAATYSLLMIGVMESVAVSWVYGGDRFLTNIESMLGYRPSYIWVWCWRIIIPVGLLTILVSTWVEFTPTEYYAFVFPGWADGIGWLISATSIIAIPFVMIFKVIKQYYSSGCSIIKSIMFLCKADAEWDRIKNINEGKCDELDLEAIVGHHSSWTLSDVEVDSTTKIGDTIQTRL